MSIADTRVGEADVCGRSEGGVTTPSSLGIATPSWYTCGPTFGNSQGKASGNLLAPKNLLARKILAAWKILPALWQ